MAVIKPEDTSGPLAPVQAVQPPPSNGVGQTHSVPAGVLDFSDLRAKRQLLIAISAAEKSGKTDWALRSGPGDAYLVVLDPNSIEIAKKVQRESGRRIHYKDFQWGTRISDSAAVQRWADIQEFVQWAVSQPAGTLVFDTETQLKKLCDYAFVGQDFKMAVDVRIARSMQRNDAMRALINVIRAGNLSATFLQRLGEKYVNDKPSGIMEPRGWGDLPYEITTVMRFWFDPATPAPASPFRAYIGLHGPNPDYAGTEWYRGQPPEDDPEGGDLSFQKLLDLTFGPE